MARWTGGSSSSRLRSISFRALTGMTGLPVGVGGVVLGLGRGRHPGQPAAVGADHRDRLGRQLDQHAAQGVAGALDVGGEDRPADQLLQVGGGDDVIARRGEVGNLGIEARVLARQRELRVQAADDRAGRRRPRSPARRRCWSAGSTRSAPSAGSPRRAARPSRRAPGGGCRPPGRCAIRIEPSSASAIELDVLEDRLGAPRRNHPADHPERGEQSFAVAQGLHALSPPETCSLERPLPAGRLRSARGRLAR